MSQTQSPITAEGFAWLSNLSKRARDELVRAMAEAGEYAGLIAFAAGGATHTGGDDGKPVFDFDMARTVFVSLNKRGDEAYPAIRHWLDALIERTPSERRLDEAARLLDACTNRMNQGTWEMMLEHLNAAIPGLLDTPTESLIADGQKRSVFAVAISGTTDTDDLPSIFGSRIDDVPMATPDMNVIEYALYNGKPKLAEGILSRCADPEAVKEAMGRRAAAILLSEEKLPLYSNWSAQESQQAAIIAFNLIAGGAKIDHDTWQKLFKVQIRGEGQTKAAHSLPWVVTRYLEPYQAAQVLKPMIEVGGLDPNYTISSRSTLLHAAVKKNSIAAAEVLLAAGADPTRLDRQKLTPAKVAEERGAAAIGQLMHAAEMRWKILEVANQAKSTGAAP